MQNFPVHGHGFSFFNVLFGSCLEENQRFQNFSQSGNLHKRTSFRNSFQNVVCPQGPAADE